MHHNQSSTTLPSAGAALILIPEPQNAFRNWNIPLGRDTALSKEGSSVLTCCGKYSMLLLIMPLGSTFYSHILMWGLALLLCLELFFIFHSVKIIQGLKDSQENSSLIKPEFFPMRRSSQRA